MLALNHCLFNQRSAGLFKIKKNKQGQIPKLLRNKGNFTGERQESEKREVLHSFYLNMLYRVEMQQILFFF